MKHIIAILVVIILTASSSAAVDLKKLGLDDASAIGIRIETDGKVKAEGKGSIRITTQWPTTICLAEVTDVDVENATLVYKAKVKTELEGNAFLEMWVQVGDGQYFSKGMNDVVSQKTDWKTIQTPFLFQKGQRPSKVTLNIVINGKGIVWVDDIVLSKEPLK
jgi:hypothetical protein